MNLFELKVEFPSAAAGLVDDILLENGFERWSVFDDVIARRAWVAGICSSATEASDDWERLSPLLAAGGVIPLAAPAERALSDAD